MSVDNTPTWSASATASSSTAAVVSHPVDTAVNAGGAGDLLLLFVGYGNSTDAVPSITAGGTGWSLLGTPVAGGSGSWGVDTGNRGCAVWWKTADGSETDGTGASVATVSVTNGGTGTDRIMRAVMVRHSIAAGTGTGWATPVVRYAADSSLGTGLQILAASDPGGATGDALIGAYSGVPSGNNHTGSNAGVFTWAGITTLTSAAGSTGTATGGNKVRLNVYNAPVTGSSTAAPSLNLTLTAPGGAGAGALVRLRTTGNPPSAFAGINQTVEPWSTVTLNGTESQGTGLTHAWTQLSGTSVTLGGSGAIRTFTAPATVAGETLTFRLTVTDASAATDTADLEVEVLPPTEFATKAGVLVPLRLQSE